jgi:DNA-binding MarR family transcriptional regulator
MFAKMDVNSPDFNPADVLRDAEGSFARKMLHIYRAFNALAQQKYEQRGYTKLNPAHVMIMAHLDRDGIRIVDLAARLGTTKQFAGRLVQELAQLGYVTIQPDPTDKRASRVKGTPIGWQFLLDACEVQLEIETIFRSALGDDLYKSFNQAIDVLAGLGIDISQSPEAFDGLAD